MVTTHVLDTLRGRPALGVRVLLEHETGADQWLDVARGETDADGRLRTLLREGAVLGAGIYRLVFDTRRYFEAQGVRGFYPCVIVVFEILPGETHYHVPLLLGPFSYTTYRGS